MPTSFWQFSKRGKWGLLMSCLKLSCRLPPLTPTEADFPGMSCMALVAAGACPARCFVGATMSWVEPAALTGLDNFCKWFWFAFGFLWNMTCRLRGNKSFAGLCVCLEGRWKSPRGFVWFVKSLHLQINLGRGLKSRAAHSRCLSENEQGRRRFLTKSRYQDPQNSPSCYWLQ